MKVTPVIVNISPMSAAAPSSNAGEAIPANSPPPLLAHRVTVEPSVANIPHRDNWLCIICCCFCFGDSCGLRCQKCTGDAIQSCLETLCGHCLGQRSLEREYALDRQ